MVRPGRDDVQAVPRLPRRVHGGRPDHIPLCADRQERRFDVCMHAENGGAIDDIMTTAGRGEDRAQVPRAAPARCTPTPRPRDRGRRRSPARRCSSSICPLRSDGSTAARDGASPRSPRRVPNTCSSPTRATTGLISRARSTSLPRRCGRRIIWSRCGRGLGRSTSRRSPPTTAPSSSRPEDPRQGRFHQDPQWRPRRRGPPPIVHHGGVFRGVQPEQVGRHHLDDAGEYVRHVPKKGDIAPGSDADIVIFDPNRNRSRSAPRRHMNCDYNLSKGMRQQGIASDGALAGGEDDRRERQVLGARRRWAVPQAGCVCGA